jgi:hypothetical protein
MLPAPEEARAIQLIENGRRNLKIFRDLIGWT